MGKGPGGWISGVCSTFALMVASGVMAPVAQAGEPLVLQLKWVNQAQFAGYFIAKDKGFYEAEDLDVEIKAGGPDVNPIDVMVAGDADVIVEWMPAALVAREQGQSVVNIAQPFKFSALQLTCHKRRGITRPSDLRGKTIGIYPYSNSYPLINWLSGLGIPLNGGTEGATLVTQELDAVSRFVANEYDCISTMAYNEYPEILDQGLNEDDLSVFRFENLGVATLEDGLYVLAERLDDPAFVNRLGRFVRASMQGWSYAKNNPDETVDSVLANDAAGLLARKHQQRMLKEVIGLLADDDGILDFRDYARTVILLLNNGSSDALISATPEGAWTHRVTDAAFAGGPLKGSP